MIPLILELCTLDGTTGQEKSSVDFLESFLKKNHWRTRRQPVGPTPGRDNLWAFASDAAPNVIFTTHLDTVPDYIPPALSEDKETLTGRGVCDAKGIAVCMIMAAEQLRKEKIPVGLLFVVGEETNSDGAKAAGHFGVKAKYVINGEPTQLKLVRAMKGVVAFELSVQGVPAHSAYPEAGYSAVHHLIHDMEKLLHAKWPVSDDLGPTTLNIGMIRGGKAANVLADSAWAKGMIRATVPSEAIIRFLKSTIHPQTELNIITSSDPQYLHTVKGIETDVVSFGSDVPYLRAIGEPLLLGPGSILDAHTTHEQIKVKDLYQAVELYIKLGRSLTQ